MNKYDKCKKRRVSGKVITIFSEDKEKTNQVKQNVLKIIYEGFEKRTNIRHS